MCLPSYSDYKFVLSYIKPVITPLEVSYTLVRAFSVRMLVSPAYQTPS